MLSFLFEVSLLPVGHVCMMMIIIIITFKMFASLWTLVQSIHLSSKISFYFIFYHLTSGLPETSSEAFSHPCLQHDELKSFLLTELEISSSNLFFSMNLGRSRGTP